MKLSDNALIVLQDRYLKRDKDGNVIEEPEAMFKRVAKDIAKAEETFGEDPKTWENIFLKQMLDLKFLPNSPTLLNAGRDFQQLAACYVLPIEDSMEGIMQTIYDTAMIQRSGGGCLIEGTLVMTQEKGLIPIEEVKVGMGTFGYNRETGKTELSRVLAKYKYDIKKAYRIELEGKSYVTVSDWHPFLVFDGKTVYTKRADELSKEDLILTPHANPAELGNRIHKISKDWLLGYFLGNGNFSDVGIKMSVGMRPQQKAVVEYFKDAFNYDVKIHGEPKKEYIAISDYDITHFFQYYCMGKKSETAYIHDDLMKRQDVIPIIAGFYDADGWTGPGKISFEVVSEVLSHQVVSLLSFLGIKATISYHKSGIESRFGETFVWRVQVSSKEGLDRFKEIFQKYLRRLKVPEIKEQTTTTYFDTAVEKMVDEKTQILMESAKKVKKISKVEGGIFYDFTTKLQNYAAGNKGLIFVHNTGFSFSRLRPKGALVSSSMGQASGPISFLKMYDALLDTIKQGGMRRGAGMATLRIDHPDIQEFIHLKDRGGVETFNISVAATDEFMEAIVNDDTYNLQNPHTLEDVGTLSAKQVFREIAESAWKTGDPGVWFIDTTNKSNPTPQQGDIESTNPCGEQPLLPYEACNLGSINLSKFVKGTSIDWDELRETVHVAVRFLDDVIDRNLIPVEKIQEKTKYNRKIGLGVMGFADMLVMLGIPYDSEQAIATASRVMEFIDEEAFAASLQLAEEKGPFPGVEESIYADLEKPRNATRTTIAPTGTISIIADVSSGIEPFYSLAYERTALDGKTLIVKNEHLKQLYPNIRWSEVISNGGTVQKMNIPDEIKRLFKTALEIHYNWHIKLQAAFQESVDNAVSKTINMPNNATVEDVENAYLQAWKAGCKGITIYRDGSRSVQVLKAGMPTERPEKLEGLVYKYMTGCGNIYITVSKDSGGKMYEVFATLGKAGGCAAGHNEGICRLVSVALRTGVNPAVLAKQLRSIRCPAPSFGKMGPILSCPDAIGKAMQDILTSSGEEIESQEIYGYAGNCPRCDSLLVFQEGCARCKSCGWEKCG